MEKMRDTVGIEDNENVVEEDESDQEDLLIRRKRYPRSLIKREAAMST